MPLSEQDQSYLDEPFEFDGEPCVPAHIARRLVAGIKDQDQLIQALKAEIDSLSGHLGRRESEIGPLLAQSYVTPRAGGWRRELWTTQKRRSWVSPSTTVVHGKGLLYLDAR